LEMIPSDAIGIDSPNQSSPRLLHGYRTTRNNQRQSLFYPDPVSLLYLLIDGYYGFVKNDDLIR